MKKYSRELINKYINGDDIDNYSIEELENDKEFMIQVIETTNDKNFYNLCSEKLKKDYSFVKYIIYKFRNNINFICNVADYYLNHSDNELDRTELVIIMTKLIDKRNEQYQEYKVMSEAMSDSKRVQIELAKLKSNDEYANKEIGMGFLLIFDSYNSSKLVLDFYAKKLIEEIFKEYDIDLESMLHKQFGSKEKISKIGINNYMLNFIGVYDSMLASYLSTNINLMKDFYNKINAVLENWNNYSNNDEEKKFNLLFDRVHEYMEPIEFECVFTETDLLYYIGKKLGIIDKIIKYDNINSDMAKEIIDGLDDDFFENTIKLSFKDRIHYNNVKKIMSSIIFSNTIDDKKINQSNNTNKKVLKLNTIK